MRKVKLQVMSLWEAHHQPRFLELCDWQSGILHHDDSRSREYGSFIATSVAACVHPAALQAAWSVMGARNSVSPTWWVCFHACFACGLFRTFVRFWG